LEVLQQNELTQNPKIQQPVGFFQKIKNSVKGFFGFQTNKNTNSNNFNVNTGNFTEECN